MDIQHEVWGVGQRVVLVHSSLATGPDEWEGQRALVAEGYELVVPTRRAYTAGNVSNGEDFLVGARDVVPLLGDDSHLVGHSYGAIVAMLAAAARPGAVRSLVLAEPPLFTVAPGHPDVARLREQMQDIFAGDVSDREFLERFLTAVGAPVEELPPEVLDELTGLVSAVRLWRPPWDAEVPLGDLASAPFPILVLSGNHHPAFTAICDALAAELRADQRRVEGGGHEMQTVTEDYNTALLDFWRRADDDGQGHQAR